MRRNLTDHAIRLLDAMLLISMVAVGLAMAIGPYRNVARLVMVGAHNPDYPTWSRAKDYIALVFPCITR